MWSIVLDDKEVHFTEMHLLHFIKFYNLPIDATATLYWITVHTGLGSLNGNFSSILQSFQDNCMSFLSDCVNQLLWMFWTHALLNKELPIFSGPKASSFIFVASVAAQIGDIQKCRQGSWHPCIIFKIERFLLLQQQEIEGCLKLAAAAAWHWGRKEKKDSWLEMTHFELFSFRL